MPRHPYFSESEPQAPALTDSVTPETYHSDTSQKMPKPVSTTPSGSSNRKNMNNETPLEEVRIEKLVHGGQALGRLSDGRKVFVWNALPGELVKVRLTKKKKDYAEGFAEEIIEPSKDRVEPKDEAYLSTSPWQIMKLKAENAHKKAIIAETFAREHVELPDFSMASEADEWHYRNKMEYSFWADDYGLHLALFNRASHGKRTVTGSSIARPEIDETANKVVKVLQAEGIRGSQLKTIVVRVDAEGNSVCALFVKDEKFPKIPDLEGQCKGVVVCFSNPKSPASVLTKKLYEFGDVTLTDLVLGKPISYNVHSFFQVNLPVFEQAAKQIKVATKNMKPIVDFYSGVGTIGLSVGAGVLVDSEKHNIEMAQKNADKDTKIILAAAETALDHVPSEGMLIVDPPRIGLHKKLIDEILKKKPEKIAYLSCNPVTQARDLKLLSNDYKILFFEGYNFFPRTPHIETLVILERV